jgi:hypothetical protein
MQAQVLSEGPVGVHNEKSPHPPLLVRHLLIGRQFVPLEDEEYPELQVQLCRPGETYVQRELVPQFPLLVEQGSITVQFRPFPAGEEYPRLQVQLLVAGPVTEQEDDKPQPPLLVWQLLMGKQELIICWYPELH